MKKTLFAGMLCAALCSTAPSILAGDAELCLDCHEPAEDWEGMSAAEILTDAKDLSNKRHKDNADLSDEQMKAIIAELMPK